MVTVTKVTSKEANPSAILSFLAHGSAPTPKKLKIAEG